MTVLRGKGKRRFSPAVVGIGLAVAAVAAGVFLFNKDRVITTLTPGETVRINFERDYHLREFITQAKVSGVPVGKVSSVEEHDNGTAMVEVKIDSDVLGKLGAHPSAAIRPTTMLGGNYYVDLVPGGGKGAFSGEIPAARTKIPVELDKVARALQPSALQGMRSSTARLDETLKNGGTAAIDRLLADAPPALAPAGEVLAATRGTNPRTDLPNLVRGLESTSRVLDQHEGQLDAIVRDLDSTSSVLGNRSNELADTIDQLPSTLDTANTGLSRLDTTLGKLRDTAGPAMPIARELDRTLEHADPVLRRARPLVTDLKNLLSDAHPLVRDLVPASRRATTVLDNLSGPVLDRVNGPIKDFVMSPYSGKGPYAGSGSDRPVYQEVGFMFANLTRATSLSDRNGHAISFHPGIGPGSVAGLPISAERLFTHLLGLQVPKPEGGPR